MFRQGGQERTVTARREVVLFAGALQSPQVLQLSGIGDADLLKRWCINVVGIVRLWARGKPAGSSSGTGDSPVQPAAHR